MTKKIDIEKKILKKIEIHLGRFSGKIPKTIDQFILTTIAINNWCYGIFNKQENDLLIRSFVKEKIILNIPGWVFLFINNDLINLTEKQKKLILKNINEKIFSQEAFEWSPLMYFLRHNKSKKLNYKIEDIEKLWTNLKYHKASGYSPLICYLLDNQFYLPIEKEIILLENDHRIDKENGFFIVNKKQLNVEKFRTTDINNDLLKKLDILIERINIENKLPYDQSKAKKLKI